MKRAAPAAVVALIGGAIVAVEAALDPTPTAFACLAALSFAIATTWGALLVLMTGLAARARWAAAWRRPLEAVIAAQPILCVAMVALLIFADRLYPWLDGGPALAPYEARAVELSASWHALGWLRARSAVYLLVPLMLGEGLTHLSRRLMRTASPSLDRARSRVAVAGLVVTFATGSFAAFDWVMALEPSWVSTIYGAAWLASGYVSGLAALILAVACVRLAGGLSDLPADSVHRIGKLLLAATCVWAYLSFCQLLLIYIADLPTESRYFLRRREGVWGALATATAAGSFAIPFLALLPVVCKRRLAFLAPIALVALVGHVLEHAWLVLPARPDVHPSWLATAGAFAAAIGAAITTMVMRSSREVGEVPLGDPLWRRAIAEEA
ncbi:MAG: hypothetical protein AB7S26_27390 [Sandaracinaceae bacterium]